MSLTLDELKQQAAKLSDAERAQLALFLIGALDAPVDEGDVEGAWQLEIERRVAQYERGEVELIPGDEVFAEARRLLE